MVVNFKLGDKDDTSVRQRKNLSPDGIIYFIILYHDDFDNAVPRGMLEASHTWTQFNGLALHEFSGLSG